MLSLEEDLCCKKLNLDEFRDVALRVLQHLPNVLTGEETKNDYKLHVSTSAGLTKALRPINQNLFIYSPREFEENYQKLIFLFDRLRIENGEYTEAELFLIDSVLYTIQQSIGCALDLLSGQNRGRKHVGNRFEELIRAVFDTLQISNKPQVLKIPYKTDEGEKMYSSQNDLILSPYSKVRSTSKHLDEKEIVVSVKTTSKDRMGKMFIDKILLERFVKHEQKVIGIFLNDVQRKENDNISFTLVSNLFMVYTQFLVELDGVYYLDPPPNAHKDPFNKHIAPFSHLLTKDIWRLLSS